MSQSKEVHKAYMKDRRKVHKDQGSQQGSQLLHRPNGEDYDPEEKIYNHPFYADGVLRYMGPLSDGRVLDRLTVRK